MMRLCRAACGGLLLLLLAPAADAQSTLERTPNLPGGWTGDAGLLHFHFLHRFNHSGAPQRQVQGRPTFQLAYSPLAGVLGGVRYSTRSALVAAVPNEWEVFARARTAIAAPVELGLEVGYNQAAGSLDGELSVAARAGPLRPLLAFRVLGRDGERAVTALAAAAGVVLRVHEYVALAADAGRRLNNVSDARAFWGAGVQLRIPHSPHTLSLQAANTDATTLQSGSRGSTRTRWGFEFTVPVTPSRYFGAGRRSATATATADTTVVIRHLQFRPARLEVRVGAVVSWRNEDPLEHTVTAVDSTWDSGAIAPQASWSRRFDARGTYELYCSPHPFMRAVVVVR